MSIGRVRGRLVVLALAGAYALGISLALGSGAAHAAATKPIKGDTPAPVAQGKATAHGHHNGADVLRLNVGLAVRDSSGLDALIRAASTPGSPQYGHYLTNAQYLAKYAPTEAEVRAARSWLTSQGLAVTGVSSDNLLVHVEGKAKDVERAFDVVIDDYSHNGRAFHSNDRDPSVPADLSINWISGLSNYDVAKPDITCTPSNQCSYDGGDLRGGYDVVGDGKGQTIGFTLWGGQLPQSDFTAYATATGTTALTVGGAGDDGLDFIQVDGAGTNSTGTDSEIALDTENAHGVAPGVHETYWLGKDNSFSTLEDVLNQAANSSISIISNSWGSQANPCSVDSNMETSLQHGVATGKTFYFSTGDGGASVGCEYPAVSQYVVSVGGTALTLTNATYTSETAVNNGGGCLGSEPRPSWQTGIGTAYTWGSPPTVCTGRAEPDVAAISGFCTDGSNCGPGTYIYFDGSAQCCYGGTSLATPVWAAASVIWNKNNAASGRPGIGFSAPLIYALANDPTTYANDFHDITSGTNGFSATTGWDEATGWGSADFNKLQNNIADVSYTGPTQAAKGDTIILSATLLDHNASTTLATAALGTLKVSLAAAGSFCDANVDSSGHASCSVTVNDDPGHYKAIAAYAGDAAYKGGSNTVDFTVLHIPTKITYNGATSGDYHDPATLSATLSEDISGGTAIAGRTLNFSLGAETCSGVTNGIGFASCSVTPQDVPGSYSVVVSFAGDEPLYEPSSASAAFTLKKEETTAKYVAPTVILAGSGVATLTGKLVEDGANDNDGDGGSPGPVPAQMVTLSVGGQSCTGTTSVTGDVSCTIPSVIVPLGPETVGASFAGDSHYLPSSDTANAVVFAFPSRGAFVLGDITAATAGNATVTWWADNWSLLNALSGGTAPSAFKGFAGVITLPTTTPPVGCGSAWTTGGGNSPPPTSGVPAYMGVVVASAVTKKGTAVAGNSVHIVVVKTNPGYQPDPFHHGTGTIVATFC
jgi:kumamolisin